MALRPLAVEIVLALVAIALGFAFNPTDSRALPALSAVAVLLTLSGAVRAGIWLLVGGWCTLTIANDVTTLESRTRCVDYPIEGIRSITITPGDAWPELSRWATLPAISVELVHGEKVSAKILLPDRRVAAVNREIENALLPRQ